jgi:hypothetical protein
MWQVVSAITLLQSDCDFFAVGESHQAREVILVVAARPRLGAVLAASVVATVVADHMEAARGDRLRRAPTPAGRPASVNQHERVAAAGLLHQQPYAVDLA